MSHADDSRFQRLLEMGITMTTDVTRLDLGGKPVTLDVIQSVSDILSDPRYKLSELSLRNTNLTLKSLSLLSEGLKDNASLKKLDLKVRCVCILCLMNAQGTVLGSNGANALGVALRVNSTLSALSLDLNTDDENEVSPSGTSMGLTSR